MTSEHQETLDHLAILYIHQKLAEAKLGPPLQVGMSAMMYEDPEHLKKIGRVIVNNVYYNTFGEEACDVQAGFYVRKGVLAVHLERWTATGSFLRSVLDASTRNGDKC